MPPPILSADTKPSVRRFWKIALLAILFSWVHGRICFANDTYTFTQNQQLAFGTLQQPSSGTQTLTVSLAGGTSGTGTLLYGVPANGDFTVKCSGVCASTITLNVVTSSINCTGVSSIGSYNINYNNGEYIGAGPISGLSNPGAGGKDLKVGATATYSSSVNAGNCLPLLSYTVNGLTAGLKQAQIGFDLALSLTKNSDINFGTVTANNASTYRISPAGAMTTVSGTGSYLTGATSAASITIAGSTTDGITISAGGYIANNGVTPSNAQCSYNGGAAAACAMTGAAPGAGTPLLVGVDVTTDGTQAGGTSAAPTFTISVAYQ